MYKYSKYIDNVKHNIMTLIIFILPKFYTYEDSLSFNADNRESAR